MTEMHWGSPHKHVPVIGGRQFHYHGAYFAKERADSAAERLRREGYLARVQKHPQNHRRGEKRYGYCWVVFKAMPSKIRRRRKQ